MVNNQKLLANYELSEETIKSKHGTTNPNLRFNYINENPSFFESLYENYKLSDEKSFQLKRLAKLSSEAIFENKDLCGKILSWEKQDENEKFKTLQDLTKFLTIDSGINDFKAYVGDNVPKIKFKSTEKGVGGFFF